jgi:hypothetical protein
MPCSSLLRAVTDKPKPMMKTIEPVQTERKLQAWRQDEGRDQCWP